MHNQSFKRTALTGRRLTPALVAMGIRIAIVAASVIALAGCSKPLDLVLPKDQPLKLVVNPQSASLSTPAKECSIAPGSAKFKKLAALLAAQRSNWRPSSATYVPSVVVTGANFSINFLQGLVVVNYAKGQFTHPVPKAAYAFLQCRHGV